MQPQTLQALQALAQALNDNPADSKELKIYGNLPEHLIDAINDYEQE